ncbi:MAG: sulfur carrier protein ThiS [Chitinivibrionales bacterium]|nr:sulfur carrier protein ThiS [Chitinivibrionales bacterium]
MKLRINGKTIDIDGEKSISKLLQEKSINPLHVVVEINTNIIVKELFGSTNLKENDAIEIIRFVGGG